MLKSVVLTLIWVNLLALYQVAIAEDGIGFSFRYIQETKNAPLTIEYVSDLDDERWSLKVSQVRAGIGGAPVWIELPSLRPGSVLEITQSIDEGMLYEATPEGTWQTSTIGDSVSVTGRGMSIAPMAFALSESVSADTKRYLRVTQPNTSAIALKVWSFQGFRTDLERRRLIQSLLLGFVCAIVLYNLVITVIAREVVFGLNASVIASIVAIDLYLSGVGAQWLWPKPLSNAVLNTALAATCALGALFIDRFLRVEKAGGTILSPLKYVFIAAVCLGLAQVLAPYWLSQALLLVLIVVFLVCALAIAIGRGLRGDARAQILLIPLGLVMAPGSLVVLTSTLFGSDIVPLRPHILELTLATEALAFSLALASLIRIHAAEAAEVKSELLNTKLTAAGTFASLQDRERARIASDLHDSIGHNLVLASSILEATEPDNKTDEASKIIRATLSNVRRISHDLHPSTLVHLGWENAISSLFSSLEEVYAIAVEVRQTGDPARLSARVQTHLYRIIQEAISNIIHHAQASRCRAEIMIKSDSLRMIIEDDGQGNADDIDLSHGLGLNSIAERVRALRGEWRFFSPNETGFRVEVEIPLEAEGEGL